jgi:hypothetical protein
MATDGEHKACELLGLSYPPPERTLPAVKLVQARLAALEDQLVQARLAALEDPCRNGWFGAAPKKKRDLYT